MLKSSDKFWQCVSMWNARKEVGAVRNTCRFGGLGRVGLRHGDAHVVLGKLVAGEHLRPGEAERLHDGGASIPHGLAQPAARVDGPLQAQGRKERAQEDLRARVAALVHQGHPAAGLLLRLGHGFVLQQVGQQHLVVAHVVAQPQLLRDVHALRGFAVAAAAVVRVWLPAQVLVLWRTAQWQERHRHRQPHHPPERLRSGPHCFSWRKRTWMQLSAAQTGEPRHSLHEDNRNYQKQMEGERCRALLIDVRKTGRVSGLGKVHSAGSLLWLQPRRASPVRPAPVRLWGGDCALPARSSVKSRL